MKSKILIALSATAMALVMTGCGLPAAVANVKPAEQEHYDSPSVQGMKVYTVVAHNKAGMNRFALKDGPVTMASIWLAMQKAATYAMDNGYSNFTIYRPLKASQFEARGPINTADFAKKCLDEDAEGFLSSTFLLSIGGQENYCALAPFKDVAIMDVIFSNGELPGLKSFEALEVLAYMKKNGYYYDNPADADQKAILKERSPKGMVYHFEDSRNATW